MDVSLQEKSRIRKHILDFPKRQESSIFSPLGKKIMPLATPMYSFNQPCEDDFGGTLQLGH